VEKQTHPEKDNQQIEPNGVVSNETGKDPKTENQGIKQVNEQNNGDKKPKSKRAMWIIIAIVAIILVLIALAYGYLQSKLNKLNQTEIAPGDIQSNNLSAEQTILMGDYTQIALFGVDNRSNGNYGSGNSDTIMIVSVNNKTQEVQIVSVYRDTYLRTHDDYFAKANSAYAYNGAVGGISMLNTNLDLNISQYVTVDWYAVVKTIDLLGGVDIQITDLERQKINEYIREVEQVTGVQTNRLQETGVVHLDGVQAAAYMRIRKLAGDDYKRTQRQRIVIENTFEKVKKADIGTLNTIVDEIFPMIETNLKLKDILGLAVNVGRYEIEGTTGFPFEKTTTSLAGIGDCVIPITLERNVSELHTYFFEEEQLVSEEVLQISQEIIDRTGLDIGTSDIDTDSYITGGEIDDTTHMSDPEDMDDTNAGNDVNEMDY